MEPVEWVQFALIGLALLQPFARRRFSRRARKAGETVRLTPGGWSNK